MLRPISTPTAPAFMALYVNSNASFSGSFFPPATIIGTGHDSTTFSKFSQKYVFTICAPCSAAILHANDRYLASFPISFPTAVTAKTGIPYSSASLTNLPKFTID